MKYLDLLFKDLSFEFYEGLINIDTFDSKKNNLLVIDDLMHLSKDNDEIYKLFTIHSHHRNISVFLVSQNIFSKGKFAREISLNCSTWITNMDIYFWILLKQPMSVYAFKQI
jgi:Cdc6-like AAA superfamily ATPase